LTNEIATRFSERPAVPEEALPATAAPAQVGAAPLEVSVVVPTFNEAQNVVELVRRLRALLGPSGWEAIFVDDDSPDGTAALIRELAVRDPRVRCLRRVGRRGLASACVEGMMAAAAPIIVVLDADLQHDETKLPEMISLIQSGEADVVIGTRYAEGGSTGSWDPGRVRMSEQAGRAARMLLRQPVSDPMSGFFALRREVAEQTVHRLSAIGFKILLDILASAPEPVRVREVPYTFRERLAGTSKLDELVIWEFAMLLADKSVGRYVPARFLAFAIVGGVGVIVHLTTLTILLKILDFRFAVAQSVATFAAAVFNFAVNNVLTYRDRRLRGMAWLGGLLSFLLVCGVGAVANVGIATYLFASRTQWLLAALSGILVSAVWNYAVSNFYTWKRA
jgi:dolichol-phosphate mannosyltransferase